MIIRTLTSLIAAGTLMSSLAAHAQAGAAPDPNLSPSTAEEESTLPASSENARKLAKDPDPNEAKSTHHAEKHLPATSPDSPQLATDPDPDLAPSGDGSSSGE
jgi:hypothetical protein